MKFPTLPVCLAPLTAATLAVIAACKGASTQATGSASPTSGSGSAATTLGSATNTTPTPSPAPSATGSAEPTTASGRVANADAPLNPSAANPRAAEGAAMSVEEAGNMSLKMAQKLADAATAAGSDCAKLGTAVIALKPDLVKMLELGKGFDANPTKKKAFDEQYAEKLQTLITPSMTAIMKCDSNADIKSFLEALR